MDQLWSHPRTVADLGAFVTTVRRGTGRTQAQVAEAAGVSRRFVNEVENAHATLYATRLLAVLRELGINVMLTTGAPAQWPSTSDQPGVLPGTDIPRVKDLGW